MGIGHWLIVGVIVLVVMGRTNLGAMGKNIARGIKGFKEGLNEVNADAREVDEIEDKKDKKDKDQGKS